MLKKLDARYQDCSLIRNSVSGFSFSQRTHACPWPSVVAQLFCRYSWCITALLFVWDHFWTCLTSWNLHQCLLPVPPFPPPHRHRIYLNKHPPSNKHPPWIPPLPPQKPKQLVSTHPQNIFVLAQHEEYQFCFKIGFKFNSSTDSYCLCFVHVRFCTLFCSVEAK